MESSVQHCYHYKHCNIIYYYTIYHTTGKIILYFKKDSGSILHYGDRVLLQKPLQRITNPGNPAEFDFAQFSAMQQIYHQLYLTKKDWIRLQNTDADPFKKFIYAS